MGNKVAIAFMVIFVAFAGLSLIKNEPKTDIKSDVFVVPDYSNSRYNEIYFAGGCFWGVQAYFDRIQGIIYTDVGYINGETEDTSYFYLKDTKHAEAAYLVYDPQIISLKDLVKSFYSIIDPTTLNKQGPDAGIQYRTGIYYTRDEDLDVIQKVTEVVQENYAKEIVTEIEPLKNYIVAEVEHQDYLLKNPSGYCHIILDKIPNEKPKVEIKDYKVPAEEIMREKLTALQYMVTQESDTEPPFDNKYWENEDKGIYVDIISGEPLFLSTDKYDSNSGWPSFTRPISKEVLTYHYDNKEIFPRIEVRSRISNSHLGHVFEDGPKAEGGLRYCMNSAALEFIPFEEMIDRKYEKFKILLK